MNLEISVDIQGHTWCIYQNVQIVLLERGRDMVQKTVLHSQRSWDTLKYQSTQDVDII